MNSASPIPSTSGLSASQLDTNHALLKACEAASLPEAKRLIEEKGAHAWYEDPEIGWSSLHFAAESGSEELVGYLLSHGAISNAVDKLGYTAAEVAYSYNHAGCYRLIFEESVRQTLIMNLLGRNAVSGEDDEEDDDEEEDGDEEMEESAPNGTMAEDDENQQGSVMQISHPDSSSQVLHLRPEQGDLANSNDAFLKSKLNFVRDPNDPQVVERCLDEDGNMVMAAWETDIMERSARLLCEGQEEGFSILNIGFGLGIIDRLIQQHKPGRHVIIEAHPDALQLMRDQGWDNEAGVEIFGCKWEDAINDLSLGSFDAVYFDTYSQDYEDLRVFFEELPNLLSGPNARFSFFHGLAGTNAFFYDVLTRVAEADLREIGLETEWHEMKPAVTEEVWEGVKRKYWTLDTYRLPLSKMQQM